MQSNSFWIIKFWQGCHSKLARKADFQNLRSFVWFSEISFCVIHCFFGWIFLTASTSIYIQIYFSRKASVIPPRENGNLSTCLLFSVKILKETSMDTIWENLESIQLFHFYDETKQRKLKSKPQKIFWNWFTTSKY